MITTTATVLAARCWRQRLPSALVGWVLNVLEREGAITLTPEGEDEVIIALPPEFEQQVGSNERFIALLISLMQEFRPDWERGHNNHRDKS
jgi:hypothetical protein